MAETKRTEAQVLLDRKRILKYLEEGLKTHTEIAEEINKRYKADGLDIELSRQMITYDIQRIYEELESEIQKEAPKVRALQIRRYLFMANQAYQGWLKSQRRADKQIETDKDGEYGFHQIVKMKEERAGDPRFLLVMERCLDKVNRMFGTYVIAPEVPADSETEKTEDVDVEIPFNNRD